MQQHGWLYYAWVGGCIALAFVIRYKRMGRTRPLRLRTMWIFPAVFVALGIFIIVRQPPSALGWLTIALALSAGGALGWYRARWVEIGVDPESGRLNQRSSPAALLFLAALMAFRWALRSAVTFGDARWHLGAALIGDIFIAFAVGLLGAYRIEIYWRARRVISGTNPIS